MKLYRFIFFFVIAFATMQGFLFATQLQAQPVKVPQTHPEPLAPDSSNFVTVGMLIMSPSNVFYSNLGHAVLRMECPSFDLDFCFSFETDTEGDDYLRFFGGKANGHIVAVPTNKFLESYQKEGRQVVQYELNLTLKEKQELWRMLDNNIMNDELRKFNFLQNNCSSVSFRMVEDALIEEQMEYAWPEIMYRNNGDGIRFLTRNSPWMSFISITLVGTEADGYWDQRQRVTPETLIPIYEKTLIADKDGNKRPALTGTKTRLLPLRTAYAPTRITPLVVFSILLLLVILVTVAERWFKCNKPAKAVDAALLTVVTLSGVLLVYMSTVSSLFGQHWNWYLIPFSPLPAIIWLLYRKRKNFYKVYLFYSIVLVLFILATPLSAQLDIEHQLITASLAVRCFALFSKNKGRGKE